MVITLPWLDNSTKYVLSYVTVFLPFGYWWQPLCVSPFMVLSRRGKSSNNAQDSVAESKKESSSDNIQNPLVNASNGVGTHLASSFRMSINFFPAILLLEGKISLCFWYSTSVWILIWSKPTSLPLSRCSAWFRVRRTARYPGLTTSCFNSRKSVRHQLAPTPRIWFVAGGSWMDAPSQEHSGSLEIQQRRTRISGWGRNESPWTVCRTPGDSHSWYHIYCKH